MYRRARSREVNKKITCFGHWQNIENFNGLSTSGTNSLAKPCFLFGLVNVCIWINKSTNMLYEAHYVYISFHRVKRTNSIYHVQLSPAMLAQAAIFGVTKLNRYMYCFHFILNTTEGALKQTFPISYPATYFIDIIIFLSNGHMGHVVHRDAEALE